MGKNNLLVGVNFLKNCESLTVFRSAPLCYEIILLCLGLHKAVEIRRYIGFRGLRLMKTIVYDQAMYFLL